MMEALKAGLRPRRMRFRTGLAAAVSVAACGDPPAAETRSTIADSSGIRVITAVTPGTAPATTVLADQAFGRDRPITRIDDAVVLPEDRIGVLDGATGGLWIFDARSGEALEFGGKGQGRHPPVRRPAAVVVLGGRLAVWDPGLLVFTLYDLDGRFAGTIPQPARGDVGAFARRETSSLVNHQRRVNATASRLWLQLEDDEYDMYDPLDPRIQKFARQGYITRLAPDGMTADTVLTYAATTRIIAQYGLNHPDGLFPPTALWSVQDTLLAYARTDTAEVRLSGPAGELNSVLRWEPMNRPPGTEDRNAHGIAFIRENPGIFPPDLELDDPETRAMFDESVAALVMPDVMPELSALALHGSCLWIARFDFESNADGLSRTWSYYSLRDREAGTVTFDTIATRIMDIRIDYALGRIIDDEYGIHYVRRYPLPSHVRDICTSQD